MLKTAVFFGVAPNRRDVYYTRLSDNEPKELHYNRIYITAERRSLLEYAGTLLTDGEIFYDMSGCCRLQVWLDFGQKYYQDDQKYVSFWI